MKSEYIDLITRLLFYFILFISQVARIIKYKYHARIGKDTEVPLHKSLWKLCWRIVCPIKGY